MGYGSFGTRERFRAPVALRYTLFELSSRRASSLANFEHRQSSIDINHVDSIRCEYSPIYVSVLFFPVLVRVSVHSVGADTSLYGSTPFLVCTCYSAHLYPRLVCGCRVVCGVSHIAFVGRSPHIVATQRVVLWRRTRGV